MQKFSMQNAKAKISRFWASSCNVLKNLKTVILLLVLIGSIGGGLSNLRVEADTTNVPEVVDGKFLNILDCAPFVVKAGVYPISFNIPTGAEVGPCKLNSKNGIAYGYACKINDGDFTGATFNILVNCERFIGSGSAADNAAINSCVNFSNRSVQLTTGTGLEYLNGARDLSFNQSADKTKCQEYFKEFCATYWDLSKDSGSAKKFCRTEIGYTEIPNVAKVSTGSTDGISSSALPSLKKCNKLTGEELTKTKTDLNAKASDSNFKDEDFCKDDNGSVFNCSGPADANNEKTNCIPLNDKAKEQLKGGTTSSGSTADGSALGGLFSILYKVVLTILLIMLILIEYVQMIILTIMAFIISALLDLSPSAPILTKIGLPLWQIFANLANFLVVGFMIYVGAATMIGLRKAEQAGKDLVTIAVLAMLLNTTYFFLNFIITTIDGFSRLLISVFVGKGGLFGLFAGMFGLFSKVSILRDGKSAINTSDPFATVTNLGGAVSDIGKVAQQAWNGSDSELTFVFLGEALVVVSFFIILLIFKDTFVLVFARVTILLLLLITSPVWVVAFFLKDIFKNTAISASLSKLPTQLFGTIVFNFAMVLGVIITVLVTGSAQEGFKGYQLDVTGVNGSIPRGAAQAATSDSFLSVNGASLVIAGVVPVFLGVAILYFINKSFKSLIPLLDQVGTAIGNGAGEFAKGIISGDVKGGFTSTFKGAAKLATGGGQLEKIATTAPKLVVKGGVMGLGALAGTADNAARFVNLARGKGFKPAGFGQRLANKEEQFLRPFLNEGGFAETVGTKLGNTFGKDSVMQQIATQRADYINKQKGQQRTDKIALGLTEEERRWNQKYGKKIISKNATNKEALENAQGQTAAEKGQVEQGAREAYYTGAGQDALKARVLAEEQLGQLKTIADNLKAGGESEAKAGFYADPTKQSLIKTATQSTLETQLNKEVDDSNIDKVKAGLETAYYKSADGSRLVGDNAGAKLSAETVRRTTTASRGVAEEVGKKAYYDSAEGKTETNTAVVAGLNDELNKTITGNLKSNLESGAKADFYENGANDQIIMDAASSDITSNVVKKTNEVRVDKVKSIANQAAYVANNSDLTSKFTNLGNIQFGSGGLRENQENEKTLYDGVRGNYKNQEEEYEFDKKAKEEAKQEKLNDEAVAKGKGYRQAATQPAKGSREEMYAKIFDRAVREWENELNSLYSYKKNLVDNGIFTTDPQIIQIDNDINNLKGKDPRI